MREAAFAIVVIIFLAGCSGGKTMIVKIPLDANGDGIQDTNALGVEQWIEQETTESVEAAKLFFSQPFSSALTVNTTKSLSLTAEEVMMLKADAQAEYMRMLSQQTMMNSMYQIIAASHNRPVSVAGEIAEQARLAIVGIEKTDADEAVSKNMIWRTGVVAGASAYGFKTLGDVLEGASGGHNTYNVNAQQSNSQNGVEVASVPGHGEGEMLDASGRQLEGGMNNNRDRENILIIGEGNSIEAPANNMDRAWSSSGNASVDTDKPYVVEGPATGDVIINDDDGGNDTSLF